MKKFIGLSIVMLLSLSSLVEAGGGNWRGRRGYRRVCHGGQCRLVKDSDSEDSDSDEEESSSEDSDTETERVSYRGGRHGGAGRHGGGGRHGGAGRHGGRINESSESESESSESESEDDSSVLTLAKALKRLKLKSGANKNEVGLAYHQAYAKLLAAKQSHGANFKQKSLDNAINKLKQAYKVALENA